MVFYVFINQAWLKRAFITGTNMPFKIILCKLKISIPFSFFFFFPIKMSIRLGYVDIQLTTPASSEARNTCDISMMRANSEDQQKLNLISKLASVGVVNTVDCLFKHSLCSIVIQLVLDQTLQPSDINHLLDLLPFINRSRQPDESFVSVFDPITESNLLSIFLHLPSPCISPQLSWSNSHDVAYFLYNLSPRLPGMKTTLYQYQKVRSFYVCKQTSFMEELEFTSKNARKRTYAQTSRQTGSHSI